jgi:hypothetical protein
MRGDGLKKMNDDSHECAEEQPVLKDLFISISSVRKWIEVYKCMNTGLMNSKWGLWANKKDTQDLANSI